jgi:hypothetical protein
VHGTTVLVDLALLQFNAKSADHTRDHAAAAPLRFCLGNLFCHSDRDLLKVSMTFPHGLAPSRHINESSRLPAIRVISLGERWRVDWRSEVSWEGILNAEDSDRIARFSW